MLTKTPAISCSLPEDDHTCPKPLLLLPWISHSRTCWLVHKNSFRPCFLDGGVLQEALMARVQGTYTRRGAGCNNILDNLYLRLCVLHLRGCQTSGTLPCPFRQGIHLYKNSMPATRRGLPKRGIEIRHQRIYNEKQCLWRPKKWH